MIVYSAITNSATITCDELDCGFSEEFEGTWDEALHRAKQAGWKTERHDDEWIHTCSDCQDFNRHNFERYGKKLH